MLKKITSSIILFFSLFSSTFAQSNVVLESHLSVYESLSSISIISCDAIFYFMNKQTGNNTKASEERKVIRDCVAKNEIEITNKYKEINAIIKNDDAKKALKEHFIAVLNQLKGAEPDFDDTEGSYKRKKDILSIKTNDAWTKLKIELL